jgi:hypothetical protein
VCHWRHGRGLVLSGQCGVRGRLRLRGDKSKPWRGGSRDQGDRRILIGNREATRVCLAKVGAVVRRNIVALTRTPSLPPGTCPLSSPGTSPAHSRCSLPQGYWSQAWLVG